ncbi:hypothetical protein AB205_0194710 [Aquarana catesbeiana]|uniref:Uncharacterized protein n=1 Tax=Aquarana catesbeiana TaxID=8400 RepID=A0A2G9QH00_AQUCT|nr:hypothetical protein AB205_0194710 [Aquarana catesbeiana]
MSFLLFFSFTWMFSKVGKSMNFLSVSNSFACYILVTTLEDSRWGLLVGYFLFSLSILGLALYSPDVLTIPI